MVLGGEGWAYYVVFFIILVIESCVVVYFMLGKMYRILDIL